MWLSHLILPAVALSFDMVADVARQLRVGLIQARRENYVIGALVRGLSERRVFWVHVVRNAIGPTLTILGMKFANLLGGAVVLESIFALSGYGVFASQSALHGDVPAVQGRSGRVRRVGGRVQPDRQHRAQPGHARGSRRGI